MNVLGGGLSEADNYEDASTVLEAELAMLRRLGESEAAILGTRSNLAITYEALGRHEEALSMQQGVYSGYLRLKGEEDENTLREANNYAESLNDLKRFEEAKTLLRRTMPVVRRVFGASHESTFRMRWTYAEALYLDDSATLNDLHEAVTTLEETTRTARRVLGGAHPLVVQIEPCLRQARAVLHARETGDMSAIREAVEALTTGDA